MTELILNLVSTLCVFSSFALFVNWLLDRVAYSYKDGLALSGITDASLGSFLKDFPLAHHAERLIVTLLPTVQGWRKRERFGLTAGLNDWDRKLTRAGLRSSLSAEHLLALCLLSGLLTGTVFALLFLLFGASMLGAFLFGFMPTFFGGMTAPIVYLGNVVSHRISLIEKRLPFAIEFMLLAMEARAAFAGAIEIYCQQMPGDPLAEELHLALRDMELGLSSQHALASLVGRVDSDDVTAFVLAVNTALDTGQPIKDVLKVQSDVTRQRRYESAERIAKTASTKAIFPLFLVAIAVLLLLVGPMAIKLSHESLF